VPAGLTNVVAVAAGDAHSLAVRADGIVVAWGNNDDDQTSVPPGLTNAVAVAAGSAHSLAATSPTRPFLPPMVRQIKALLGSPIFSSSQNTRPSVPPRSRFSSARLPTSPFR